MLTSPHGHLSVGVLLCGSDQSVMLLSVPVFEDRPDHALKQVSCGRILLRRRGSAPYALGHQQTFSNRFLLPSGLRFSSAMMARCQGATGDGEMQNLVCRGLADPRVVQAAPQSWHQDPLKFRRRRPATNVECTFQTLNHCAIRMAEVVQEERPSKRIKLEESSKVNSSEEDDQVKRELRAGITHFVNPDTPGFSGILKQR